MTNKQIALAKITVFLVALVPFSLLLFRGLNDELGANPIEMITNTTGIWTLRFLVITLTITPLRRLTGQAILVRFRRMLGLFTFFYASLHFLTYIWLDQYFDWPFIVEDIAEHPYIIVGFSTFLILLSMAVTSPRFMIRRMGKNWKNLHRLVYLAAFLGVTHFIWQVKSDIREPLLYFALFSILMLLRIPAVQKKTPLLTGRFRSVKA
ncbi:sulfoxide reductase heme-binding subunit YedZ [bacterium BMS3Bbin11]|nr:sulfoxide reductase heme-binding subunit YedZ [bacterium BMS3Abin11]GBE45382.1 sulfoxide reductase heme-binding subunit YedZ [bacterium BMS3Bbin11]HDH08161.1 sulfoxide reductase heme-binding subunit YedZ [Gammaproteobacteria bacterium]HDH16243.1 sulfoxide reductase heme-binding subunit YedZ [Gammaproteobacteria bacterium]HDZ78276.1 sulfoxide reductase heme-binding subunit YedZ [Gammaproteobacteria bacterium]